MPVPSYKGATLVHMRQLLRDRGQEEPLLAMLSEDECERFVRMVATDWVPLEDAEKFSALALPLIYPGKIAGARAFGRDMAHKHMAGIYRFILRLTTVRFAIDQSARLWSMYHTHGRTHTEGEGIETRSVHFVVEDYPMYPRTIRETTTGFIAGLAEVGGARDPHVVRDDKNPQRWDFFLTWR